MPFRNPIVAGEELTIPAIRSDNYKDTISGWRIARDGSSQLGALAVIGDLGISGAANSDSFNVGPNGLWLPDGSEVGARLDNLDAQIPGSPENPLPGQVIKALQFQPSVVTASNSTTAEIGLLSLDTGSVPVTGWYCWEIDPISFNNGGAALTLCETKFRLTADGTAPSITSAINGYGERKNISSGNPYTMSGKWTRWLVKGARYRVLYTYSTSTVQAMNLVALTQYVGCEFRFLGVTSDTSAITGATGTGINFSAGGGSEAAPPPAVPAATKHVSTFYATWSRSYDANGAIRLGDDTPYLYQGYVSGTHGDTRSLIGFDYAAIQSALSGATSISATFGYKVAHTYQSTGTTFKFGGHNYTAKPAAWADGNVFQGTIGSKNGTENVTYTIALNSTMINNFKTGTYRGVSVGPYGSNTTAGYGYLFGATQTGKPYITFTYYK